MPLARSRLLPKLPWKAMYFDGVDDYVVIPAGFLPVNAITVEALIMGMSIKNGYPKWINAGPNSVTGIYGVGFDDGGDRISLVFTFDGRGSLFYNGEYRNVLGKWVYIANTWNGTHACGYFNGTKQKEADITGSPDWADRELVLGANHSYVENSNVQIAYVRIYNRALSENEIKWNYYHPDDPIRDGLVLWLHYDSIDEENNIWRDKTANGNDGTIYGATPVEFTKPPIRRLMPTRTQSPVR